MIGHFKAILPFEATEAITGNKHTIGTGEVFSVDLDSRDGTNITILMGTDYLVVDDRSFDACCQRVAMRDGAFFDL